MTSGEPFGVGCSAVPADGEGSFTGMTDDPVATAAGNPVLSTLVQAVQAADLGDTLNSAQDITVIAPANSVPSQARGRPGGGRARAAVRLLLRAVARGATWRGARRLGNGRG